eukprot:CAMPEP_0172407846 /NCGR_PEP_ID=MMETSP1061-20121228/75551_1 /TAXON_ID=37318 /ORGANISM="Pseudo-nitzschia pungens, Strain cf. pungens" /LENGTH=437 /DNA_ID=CAMNT_0013143957 /DNA_START=171 /DNA_END=1484 /DNA_ORIENTATION=+
MNDHDMEERFLLGAFDNCREHQHQRNFDRDRYRDRIDRNSAYRQHQQRHHHHHHHHQQQESIFHEPSSHNHHNRHRHRHRQLHNEPNWNQRNPASNLSVAIDEEPLDLFESNDPGFVVTPNINSLVAAFSDEKPIYEDEKRLEASTTRSHNNDELFNVNRYDDETAAITKASTTRSHNNDDELFNANRYDDEITATTKRIEQRKRERERERPSRSRRKPVKDDDENKDKFQVEHPTINDILCGQSRVCASHEGNRNFQAVLDSYAGKYQKATNKQEKMTMTKEIVAIIHNLGGKFLKNKDGMWEEISTVAARDKVSHALRTKVASWKRQEQHRLQQSRIGKGSSNTKKSKHRKEARRSSAPATSKTFSNISPGTSFDGSDSTASESKVSDMLRYQQQVFANLTSPPPPPPRQHNTTSTDAIDNEPLPLSPRCSSSFI